MITACFCGFTEVTPDLHRWQGNGRADMAAQHHAARCSQLPQAPAGRRSSSRKGLHSRTETLTASLLRKPWVRGSQLEICQASFLMLTVLHAKEHLLPQYHPFSGCKLIGPQEVGYWQYWGMLAALCKVQLWWGAAFHQQCCCCHQVSSCKESNLSKSQRSCSWGIIELATAPIP